MADEQLTVIVKDSSGTLTEGASVTLSPGGATGSTNAQGEAVVTLGTAKKYDVTVKAKGDTQTVPFYVTDGGSRRLEVNINYLKQLTTTTSPGANTSGSNSDDSNSGAMIAGFLVVVLLVVIAAVYFLRRKRS